TPIRSLPPLSARMTRNNPRPPPRLADSCSIKSWTCPRDKPSQNTPSRSATFTDAASELIFVTRDDTSADRGSDPTKTPLIVAMEICHEHQGTQLCATQTMQTRADSNILTLTIWGVCYPLAREVSRCV